MRNNVIYFEYGQATFIVKTELYLDKAQAAAARLEAAVIAAGRTDGHALSGSGEMKYSTISYALWHCVDAFRALDGAG